MAMAMKRPLVWSPGDRTIHRAQMCRGPSRRRRRVIPVLWLCGPPGVGKTTVGWQLYADLVDEGVPVGYVDIDQLGMCFPEQPTDPDRHELKARNLGAVVAWFEAAGCECVVVSGVVDGE